MNMLAKDLMTACATLLVGGSAASLAIAPVAALAATSTSSAQAVPPAADDLAVMNDEFNGHALSEDWTLFHEAFGWPDKVKRLSVVSGSSGTLQLEPYHSAWVRDLNAPFIFKTVHGDFDVRARVRVRSLNGAIPGGTWSLGGLMARVPNRSTATNWTPRVENWHFVTMGVAQLPGQFMTKTKGTYNSYSSLKLRPFEPGWAELRLVRVGMAMFALVRKGDGSAWELRDRFYRMESSPRMQVGLIAYTASPSVPSGPERPEVENRQVLPDAPVDMLMEADWVRFSRPKVTSPRDWFAQVSGRNPLTNPSLSDAEILSAIGP